MNSVTTFVTDALVMTMMLATKILIDMENTDEKRNIIIKMLSEVLPYETLVGVPNDFGIIPFSLVTNL